MTRRSPLALAVLALLWEAPLHPYLMLRLIKERGKERVINVGERSSLYKTIDRLRRDGLITPRETAREENRPERTVYEITEAGSEFLLAWMREMLSAPRREFPEFPAALAHLALLDQQDVLRQLEIRRDRLAEALELHIAEMAAVPVELPRLLLLEEEYHRAITTAELAWVSSVVDDLRSGELTWSRDQLTTLAARLSPTTIQETSERGTPS